MAKASSLVGCMATLILLLLVALPVHCSAGEPDENSPHHEYQEEPGPHGPDDPHGPPSGQPEEPEPHRPPPHQPEPHRPPPHQPEPQSDPKPPPPHQPEEIPGYIRQIFPGKEPKLRIGPADQFATVGECAEFFCIPTCSQTPRIEWKVLSPDGESVSNENHRPSQDGTSFKMCEVAENWSGFQVQCFVHWPFNESPLMATAKLYVRALAAPRIVLEPRKVGHYKQHSRIALQCAAHGWPLPQIAWLFISKRHGGKNFIKEDKEYRDYVKEPTRLIILGMNPDLEGVYICIAYNKLGHAKAQAHVGFDPRRVHRPNLQQLINSVNGAYGHIRAYGRAAEPNLNHKATCVMEMMNQIGWPSHLTRTVDATTQTYDYFNLLLEKERHSRDDSLPGEALHVDYKIAQYIKANLNCSSGAVPKPDCSRNSDFLRKFSSPDGSCNNAQHPERGSADTPFQRFLKAQYEKGLLLPQGFIKHKLYSGHPKPSPRVVSLALLCAEHYQVDPAINQMFNGFGQFIDHDMVLTPNEPTNRGLQYSSNCDQHCHVDLPCFPIPVPHNDPRLKGCITFKRSAAFCDSGESSSPSQCVRPREQINQVTSFLDASHIYGSSCEVMNRLRDLKSPSGFLATSHPAPGKKLDLPPLNVLGVPTACSRHVDAPNAPCFSFGDSRGNQFSGILVNHVMAVREHNRISDRLHRMNPHWCPDKVFFTARSIVSAVFQHITFNEYLPNLIGKSVFEERIKPYKGYQSDVNAEVWNEFATAAFRAAGHPLISDFFALLDKHFKLIKAVPLEDYLFSPHLVLQHDIDPIVRGLLSVAIKDSGSVASHVCERLFEKTLHPAADLVALNIQRGRDHGLASYNEYRAYCGLKWAHTWDDLKEEISEKAIETLKHVYGSPCNVDLFAGMVLERRVADSMLGPTASCLVAEQFDATRNGDRFWFENPGVFSPAQVQEIRRYTFSRLVCNTVETINHIQPKGFFFPREKSELVRCSELPDMNLEEWRDPHRHKRRCIPESPCGPSEGHQQPGPEAPVYQGK